MKVFFMVFLLIFLFVGTIFGSNNQVTVNDQPVLKNINDLQFNDFKMRSVQKDARVEQVPFSGKSKKIEAAVSSINNENALLEQVIAHDDKNKKVFNQLKELALEKQQTVVKLQKEVANLKKLNALNINHVKQKSLAFELKRSRAFSLISSPAIKNVQHQFSSDFETIKETQKNNRVLKEENEKIKRLKEEKNSNFKRLQDQIETLKQEKEQALQNATVASENKVKLEETLQNLQEKFAEKEKKNLELQDLLETIKKDLNEKEEGIKKINLEKTEINEQLIAEKNKLNKQEEVFRLEKVELIKEYEKKKQEQQEIWQQAHQNVLETNQELEKEIGLKIGSIEKLKQELQKVQGSVEEIENKNKKLAQELNQRLAEEKEAFEVKKHDLWKQYQEKLQALEKKEEEFNQLIKTNVESTKDLKEQLFLNSQLDNDKKINLKRPRSLSQDTLIRKKNESQKEVRAKVDFDNEQSSVKNEALKKEIQDLKKKIELLKTQNRQKLVKVLTAIAVVVGGVGIFQAGLFSHPRVVNLFSKIKGLMSSVSLPSWYFSMPQVSVAMPQVSSPLPWILGKIAGLRARFN